MKIRSICGWRRGLSGFVGVRRGSSEFVGVGRGWSGFVQLEAFQQYSTGACGNERFSQSELVSLEKVDFLFVRLGNDVSFGEKFEVVVVEGAVLVLLQGDAADDVLAAHRSAGVDRELGRVRF